MPAFAKMTEAEIASILAHMLANGVLAEDEGLLWFGNRGEEEFGPKNFTDLLSVFQSPPLFAVRHGHNDLGEVHESSFLIPTGDRPVVLLGSRSWAVTYVDWSKKIAYVEPTEIQGTSKWMGSGQPLSFAFCQAISTVLCSPLNSENYSGRAREEMVAIREEFTSMSVGSTTGIIVQSENRTYWWTFAGLMATAMIAHALYERFGMSSSVDNLTIKIDRLLNQRVLETTRDALRAHPPQSVAPAQIAKAIEGLKFSVCLPTPLAQRMLQTRLADPGSVSEVLAWPLQVLG